MLLVVVFYLVNSVDLSVKKMQGILKEKLYREPKTTTRYVGEKPMVSLQAGAWILRLDGAFSTTLSMKTSKGGGFFELEVSKGVYDMVALRDTLGVKLEQQRILKASRVIEIFKVSGEK